MTIPMKKATASTHGQKPPSPPEQKETNKPIMCVFSSPLLHSSNNLVHHVNLQSVAPILFIVIIDNKVLCESMVRVVLNITIISIFILTMVHITKGAERASNNPLESKTEQKETKHSM